MYGFTKIIVVFYIYSNAKNIKKEKDNWTKKENSTGYQ